jgi:transcriptional regulator with XRE-family HTH domain
VRLSIGGRVRSRREALRLTQQELASELGVTHQHVSRIEVGQATPSLDLVVRLSRRLGVTTDFLLAGDDRPAVDVVGAIRAEPGLSAAAKKHLLGLIDELRR